jgi:aryl-alcohol dehydrogenase-like predicted oxidoreductase
VPCLSPGSNHTTSPGLISSIDTAAAYANEREVGEAIRRSEVARADVFIETKVWISDYGYDTTLHEPAQIAEKELPETGMTEEQMRNAWATIVLNAVKRLREQRGPIDPSVS